MLSNNANLAGLSLSQGALTPSFGSDQISYTAEVGNEISSLMVNPTVSGAGATVTVNGDSVVIPGAFLLRYKVLRQYYAVLVFFRLARHGAAFLPAAGPEA